MERCIGFSGNENMIDGMPDMTNETARASTLADETRWLWCVVWFLQATGALGWWWLMPVGFPLTHLRHWSNSVLPLAVGFLAALGIVSVLWHLPRLHSALIVFPPTVFLAAGVFMVVLFPISGLVPAGMLAVTAVALGVLLRSSWRRQTGSRLLIGGVAFAAVAVAFVVVFAQRAELPDTRPLNQPLRMIDQTTRIAPAEVALNQWVRVLPKNGRVQAQYGNLKIAASPLLTFESRSPDRFWTLFAITDRYAGSRRELSNWTVEGGAFHGQFNDDGVSTLQISSAPDGSITIEAISRLDKPVYSHLNSWCSFRIVGHQELALSFSPCPKQRILVTHSDYPWGDPLRLAYLDRADVFHVVEADSGEKGPFRELAAGHMGIDDSLTITLHDGVQPICRFVLSDWSAQVGRSLSPTAGWGLPVNALEFCRVGNDLRSTCVLTLSLASTSVGRGWDTVGHTAGTYRNHLRIEPVRPNDAEQ